MDLPPHRRTMCWPLRAQLFEAIAALFRPVTIQELAALVGRHRNTVRIGLQRLAEAGLVERRVVAQRRGRPRDVVGGRAGRGAGAAGCPTATASSAAGWRAQSAAISNRSKATGREIGRKLATHANGRPVAESMLDALAALGFVPRGEPTGPDGLRFVLRNRPNGSSRRARDPASERNFAAYSSEAVSER